MLSKLFHVQLLIQYSIKSIRYRFQKKKKIAVKPENLNIHYWETNSYRHNEISNRKKKDCTKTIKRCCSYTHLNSKAEEKAMDCEDCLLYRAEVKS